jgi:hypothetical protein
MPIDGTTQRLVNFSPRKLCLTLTDVRRNPVDASVKWLLAVAVSSMFCLTADNTQKRLRELGATVRPSTPEQFTAQLKVDEANVSELLKMGALKPE